MAATPPEAFGEVLREARLQRGLTQEQLALDSGYSRNYIGLLEKGLRSPSLTAVLYLAAVLDVPAADMVAEVQSRLAPLRPRRGAAEG